MKVLITGARGQLGLCLQSRITNDFEPIALSSSELDITSKSMVNHAITTLQPDLIVNCAAYTAVDQAENDEKTAYSVNCTGPENLAYAAAILGIPLIHISTDYVFDGESKTPYLPESPTAPTSVYGNTKLAGEKAVQAITSKHIIIRTAWVFSEYGSNFVKTMIKLGSSKDELGIVADQIGCPTYAGDLAQLIIMFADKLKNADFNQYGVYHFCGNKAVSWYDFAKEIFTRQLSVDENYKAPKLNPLSTAQFPTAAKRPQYSVLADNSLPLLGLLESSNWRNSLSTVINKLNG